MDVRATRYKKYLQRSVKQEHVTQWADWHTSTMQVRAMKHSLVLL